MRLILRLIAFVVLLCGFSFVGVAVYSILYLPPERVPQARAVVVLSGPGAGVQGLESETLERVDRGIEIFRQDVAPYLVMSGDGVDGDPASPGHMVAYAQAQGIPENALLREPRSTSTLHNAWYTRELTEIEPDRPIIVVTHRYHLPRAWVSFRWAGFRDITLVAADNDAPVLSEGLLLEGVKWPFNAVRAIIAWLALAVGVPGEQVLPWLG